MGMITETGLPLRVTISGSASGAFIICLINQPVPIIPLMRLVAQVLDQPVHVRHGHLEGGAGLRHHVFLDHDAAKVVRAKLQRDLADFQALRDPRALDVREVVEVDAAQRLRAQVFVRAHGGRLELGVLRLEGPADEGRKALGLILLPAQSFEVFNAVFHGFHVAKHHRGAGVKPLFVRNVHDLQPVAAHGLERGDALADAVHQYFPAATGNRAQPGLGKIRNDGFQRFVENLAEMNKLARAEPVDVHLWPLGLDVGKQVQIPLLRELGMVPALHQNLRASQGHRLGDLLVHFRQGNHIGIIVLFHAVKGAELAINIANIGVIDVAVDVVSDDFIAATVIGGRLGELAAAVGERAEFFEGQTIQTQGLGLVDPLAVPHFLQQLVQ